MSEYVGIVITFVLAGALVGAFIALASTLGPSVPSAAKSVPFECGQDPFSLPIGRLSIKFYLTAILFILFDVELVFLYPLAVVFRDLGSGDTFLTRSTVSSDKTIELDGVEYPVIDVEISSASHPFYTGKQRIMDSAGRVEKFNQRFKNFGGR